MKNNKKLVALAGALIVTAAFAGRTQVPVIIIDDNVAVSPLNGYAGQIVGDDYPALQGALLDENTGFSLFD